jgi:hypothetical protein
LERISGCLSLYLAGQRQSETVTEEPLPLDLASSQASSITDSRILTNLSVNNRDFISFVLLTPGVAQDIRGCLSFAGEQSMNSVLVPNFDDLFFNQALGGEGFAPFGKPGAYHVNLESVQE